MAAWGSGSGGGKEGEVVEVRNLRNNGSSHAALEVGFPAIDLKAQQSHQYREWPFLEVSPEASYFPASSPLPPCLSVLPKLHFTKALGLASLTLKCRCKVSLSGSKYLAGGLLMTVACRYAASLRDKRVYALQATSCFSEGVSTVSSLEGALDG